MVYKPFFSPEGVCTKRPESPLVLGGWGINVLHSKDSGQNVLIVRLYNTKRMWARCHGPQDSRPTSVWTNSFNFTFMVATSRYFVQCPGEFCFCGFRVASESWCNHSPPTPQLHHPHPQASPPAVRDDWTHFHSHDDNFCRCAAQLSQRLYNQLQIETVRLQFKAIDYSRRGLEKWRHSCHLLLCTV